MNDIEIFVRFRSSSIVPDLSSPLTVPDSSRQSCSRPRISEMDVLFRSSFKYYFFTVVQYFFDFQGRFCKNTQHTDIIICCP
jgi:hypothetical protein